MIFNNFIRSTFTNKRLNQRISFIMGAQFAALTVSSRYEHNGNWRTKLLARAGIDLNATVEEVLNKAESEVEKKLSM